MQQRCIDQGLAFVDHFGYANVASLDEPLLYLQIFRKYRHDDGLVLIRIGLAASVLSLCQTAR